MTDQLALDIAEPRARRTDPDTSHAAARSVTNLRQSQLDVYSALNMLGGNGTDEDIAHAHWRHGYRKQSPSGLRTRRKELVDAGLVHDSGERVRIETGRQAIVWTTDPQRFPPTEKTRR